MTLFRLTAATALISGVAHCIMYANVMLLGASGVVFMMILLSSVGGARSGEIPLTLLLVVVLYIGGELMQGMAGTGGGVAAEPHNRRRLRRGIRHGAGRPAGPQIARSGRRAGLRTVSTMCRWIA